MATAKEQAEETKAASDAGESKTAPTAEAEVQGNKQESKTDEPATAKPSSSSSSGNYGFVLIFLLGLCTTAAASCFGLFYRLQYPERDLPFFIPELNYNQCLGLCILTLLSMFALVLKLRKELDQIQKLQEMSVKKKAEKTKTS